MWIIRLCFTSKLAVVLVVALFVCQSVGAATLVRSKKQGAENVISAGHTKGIMVLGEHKDVIAKVVDNKERSIYQNSMSYGVDGILPQEFQLKSEWYNSIEKLNNYAEKHGKSVIFLERVGASIRPENKREIDIKLGRHTALIPLQEGCWPKQLFKKGKHEVLDYLSHSKKQGFRVEGATFHGVKESYRLILQLGSHHFLKKILNLPVNAMSLKSLKRVWVALHGIKSVLESTFMSFVGSSVLIVIDEANPENTTAKLIDVAHPTDDENIRGGVLFGLEQLITVVQRQYEKISKQMHFARKVPSWVLVSLRREMRQSLHIF